MRIVTQSAPVFYSSFPALPAPHIAGLLPPPKVEPPPVFTYTKADLYTLSATQRKAFFAATTLLLDVALEVQTGTLSERALNTALAGFRQAVSSAPARPMNPAQYAAERDVPLLEWLMAIRRGAE